jgi:hypothetical protein
VVVVGVGEEGGRRPLIRRHTEVSVDGGRSVLNGRSSGIVLSILKCGGEPNDSVARL